MNESFIELLESFRFLNIKIIDVPDFLNLVVRFLFNLGVVYVIARKIYYPIHRNKDYFFTFIIFNCLIFFVCHLLGSVKLELGFAFGLFALFSILRYRTVTVPVKEMTYLFAIISVAVINALSNKKVSYLELITVNASICFLLYYLDIKWFSRQSASTSLVYEKIENVKPENRTALLEDLRKRTGLNVVDVDISRINFLNDSARINVHYIPDPDEKSFSKASRYDS